MLNQNKIVTGLILGVLLPIIGYFFFGALFQLLTKAGIMNPDGFSETWRHRTVALLAIMLNLIPFQIFKARHFDQSMRGLIFPTVLLVIAWVIYFRGALGLG